MTLVLAFALALVAAEEPQSVEQKILYTALDEVRRAEAFYRRFQEEGGKIVPFSWVVRQERRHEKRLLKLIAKLGYPQPKQMWKAEDIKIPGELVEACSQAVSHELRQAAIYEQGSQTLRVGRSKTQLRRLARRTRYKHLPRFEACIQREGRRK